MSKEVNALDGFEFLTNSLMNGQGSAIADPDYRIVDPKEITGADDDNDDDDDDLLPDDGSHDDDDDGITPAAKPDGKKDDVPADMDDMDEEIAELVQEKLFAKFGWEVDENIKFKSMDDVADYLQQVVEANSKPEYANEEVEKLDEYVRNGGDIAKFVSATAGIEDLKSLDITNTNNQKMVVRENLKNKGYSEARITKLVDRYEDAGTLGEEAEDALELLEEYRTQNKEKLLQEQSETDKYVKEQKRLYIQGVEDTINKVDSIRGVAVSKQDKAKLMDYIFKPAADGTTQYQKDYAKNHLNLIEAAFSTMKGDSLVQQVQQKANSDAARRLKEKLAEKGKRAKDQTNQGNVGSGLWSIASGQLRKPF